MPGSEADVLQLAELFPSLSLSTIQAALRNAPSADQAAEALLLQQQQAGAPAASRAAARRPQRQQQRSASWGNLTAAAGQAQPQPPLAGLQFKPLSSRTSRQPAAGPQAELPPAPSAAQRQQRQPAVTAADQLAERHGWAGHELVDAVLAATGGDAASADFILAEMAAPQQPAALTGAQQQQQRQRHWQQQLSGGGGSSSEDEEDEEVQRDPYYRFRHHALQLTRRWQRAARAAAACYAAGRHSDARQAAAEAQRFRREALAAHAAAAEQIEAENNSGRSPFELDLHGLHIHEATAALDRRLELLHGLLAEGATGPAGGRARLRVVVGRGNHSSGGEASLPRAVENHLQAALGLRYTARGGALDVELRGSAALAGLGAAAAARCDG